MISVCGCSKPAEVPAGSSAPASVDINVSDGDVSERVKTALLQSDSLRGMDITVVTTKGDVRLTGILDSQPQVDEAIRIARAIEGVHSIHHELTIKK
jgi:osmotically-inducible protein OsmY